jgi:RNA polymerase sigma-70 factor (ECF subfamily)
MSSIVYQGYNEAQIREGCTKGDRKFQQMLYDMFSSRMFGVCLRYANEYNTAQDLLQEGFVKVYRSIEKFRGEGSFEGWVRRIFVNTAIEHLRRKTYLKPIAEKEENTIAYKEKTALDRLGEKDILNLIRELSPGYRTVFNMYVVEGYTHKEIGDILGISEGTSKSQLARARMILQDMVINHLDERDRKQKKVE